MRTQGRHDGCESNWLLMTLLNSEQVLSRLDTGDGELVLTSHRVVHGWQTRSTSIMLDDVGSVAVAPLTHRWILVVMLTCAEIAACLVVMGIKYGGLRPLDVYHLQASALLFLGAFLVVTFGAKRFSMVQISSPGDTIGFRIPSVIRKDIHRFLLNLDRVRSARQGTPVPGPAARQPFFSGFHIASVIRKDIHRFLLNLERVRREWHDILATTDDGELLPVEPAQQNATPLEQAGAVEQTPGGERVPSGRRVHADRDLRPLEIATYEQNALEMAAYKQDLERRILAGEAWLSTTLRSIGEGIIATNSKGEIAFVNPVAERLTGWSAAQAQGRGLMDVLSLHDESSGSPTKNPTFDGFGAKPRMYRLVSKAGAKTVAVESFENRSADEILGSIVVVREIPAGGDCADPGRSAL